MKRWLQLGLLLCLLVFLPVTASAVEVVIDGTSVHFDDNTGYPFVNSEWRTLVPLRATMEAFGATVRWDGETETALVTKGEVTVTCKIGEKRVFRNGTEIPNDAAAVLMNGRTYLPIRAVLEALDATVDWDGRVLVTSPGAGNLIPEIENSGKVVENFWAAWTEAMACKDAGDYWGCIDKLKEVAPTFLAVSDAHSDAMLYNNLGICYAKVGRNAEAAACYRREAELWELADGMHEAALDAERRASFCDSTVQMFLVSDNEKYSGRKYFGALYEAENGVQMGVTMKNSNPQYMNTFTGIAGKEAAGYIIYIENIDTNFSRYEYCFKEARKADKIVQCGLKVTDLSVLQSIQPNDPRCVEMAQKIAATGAKVLIRFACEMNDVTSKWYTQDTALYIEKFRYVADVFHTYAPNCAMVWSPNFYPADTMEDYYPGDEYVDYVGISAYWEFSPETDPMNLGIDRSRYEAVLDTIVGLYGHKKPIIVSEGGASYLSAKTGEDITQQSSQQLYQFLTYLPIKYPQVSAMYLFEAQDENGLRKFELSDNATYRNAYVRAIASPFYVSTTGGKTAGVSYSMELGNSVHVPAQKVTLSSYFKTFDNSFSQVNYDLNGAWIGTVRDVPYQLNVDLSAYKGQTITLTAAAFDASGNVCAQKTYSLIVD